jgi:alkylhydroperoxidase family enzyme
MTGDAVWYEASQIVGITNALNVAADTLDILGAVEETMAPVEARALFADIRDFYQTDDVPMGFRFIAHDPGYAADVWAATKHAFTDHRLPRRFKEALAFAVSMTTRSALGTALHLSQMRRFGVSARGVMEIVGVTQMFSSYTKIADTLQLEPDMGDIAPVDTTPAPGGPMR